VERLIVLGKADAGALARKAAETLARYRPAPDLRESGTERSDADGLLDDVFGDHLVVRVRGKPGGRTRLHAHDSDQLLVITSGSTLIATQTEEHVMEPGTVVWVPAGVPHRHGTAGDTEAETIYITRTPYSTTIFDTDR
jgi:quercetin dioxygenase-like cupin family protein